MADFTLKVEIKDNVRQVLGPLVGRAVELSVGEVARALQREIVRNVSGRILRVRSRALRDSWSQQPIIQGSGESTIATIRSIKAPHAAIHEWGHENLRAIRAKHLAIPLDAMRTPAGQARGTAREVIANPGAYGYPGGTFTRKGIIFGKLGRTEKGSLRTRKAKGGAHAGEKRNFVPLFVLKESVRIPARRYITMAIEQTESKASRVINAAVIDAIREGGGGRQ